MQSSVAKQYLLLKERPVIWYSLEAFEKSPVDEVIPVSYTHLEDIQYRDP